MQCFHCGRAVRETAHKPKSYLIDYYRLHSGQSEVDYLVNPKQDAPPHRYLRLIQPIDIFTCVECYARPEIRQRLDDDITGRRALSEACAQEMNFAERHTKS